MKKLLVFLLALVLGLTSGAGYAESFADQIIGARTTRSFSDEPFDAEDLEKIVQAGLAATSAMNSQPWYFAVVTNKDVMAEISSAGGAPQGARPEGQEGDMPAPSDASGTPAAPPASGMGAKAGVGNSPVAIVIYMDPNSKSTNADFDCGLACQNMVNAAIALGYGTKIVSSPTIVLNGDRHDEPCEMMNVDTNLSAVAVLLIGRSADDEDAVSSASVRQGIEEKVSYID